MAGADKGGQGLARRIDQLFFKGHPFITSQDRFAHADQPVSVADQGWNMGDLVTPGLPFFHGAAQTLEGLAEKGLDVMGLQPLGVSPFHLFSDSADTAGVHTVVDQGAVIKQITQLFPIQGMIQDRGQISLHLWPLPVADRLDEQFAQRFSLEL